LQKHHRIKGERENAGSSITEVIFQSASQKRSFLREPDEQYPISPQSPNFVLKTASQIQILKALLGAINWKLIKSNS
jgi:hypothetical protein